MRKKQALLPDSATAGTHVTSLGLQSPEHYLGNYSQAEGNNRRSAPLRMAKSNIWSIKAFSVSCSLRGFFQVKE